MLWSKENVIDLVARRTEREHDELRARRMEHREINARLYRERSGNVFSFPTNPPVPPKDAA